MDSAGDRTTRREILRLAVPAFLALVDLVREKLAGDPRGLVRAAVSSLDLTKTVASGEAPE